jgi:hypothetical protein
MNASGEILNEEFLKPLGPTANAVAKAIGRRSIGCGGRRQMTDNQPGSFRRFENSRNMEMSD